MPNGTAGSPSGNYGNGRCGKNIRNGSKIFLAVSDAAQRQGASMRYTGGISIDCQEKSPQDRTWELLFRRDTV